MPGAGPPAPILQARGLTRRFGARVAVDRLDLDVAPGEALAIFGPNGAGKSTLCRLLTSTLRPTGGTLRVAGQDPRRNERSVKRMFGVVSHQTFLYDALSARENLLFFARLSGVADPGARVDALLDEVGLADRGDDPVRGFSRGMQQRVALSRAMLHEPEILLLDEPFTGLDPQASRWLEATILALRRSGTTILLVTHDPARGLELSDRWILLARGRIAASGPSGATDLAALERALGAHGTVPGASA
jgi:heme exporter protein A